MNGGLNDILPEPISEESEKILLELLKRKMKSASRVSVELLRAMEARFGPEAREVARDMVFGQRPEQRRQVGPPEEDLREFTADLEKNCVGTHRWERVIDEPDRVGYFFTQCLWAEIYRELGEPDLGLYFCAGDEPSVNAYNSKLGFLRTKVKMTGDEVCDHIFYVKDQDQDQDNGR